MISNVPDALKNGEYVLGTVYKPRIVFKVLTKRYVFEKVVKSAQGALVP